MGGILLYDISKSVTYFGAGFLRACHHSLLYALDILSQRSFYSHRSRAHFYYGRPGKFLVAFAAISLVLRLLPKVWAKRTDLFLSAVILAYGLRCYFEFTGNYNGIVPIVKPAMYIILIAPLVMQAAAIFPDLKIRVKR
jgi:hypothetical protein